MAISVKNVTKRFGDFVALDDVSLEIPDGSLTALLGPSGSGKSTLLRVIAGLEAPDTGTVSLGGRDVTSLPAHKRGIGFVFQHYAAFKHMTVAKNIAFGLEIRRRPKAEVKDRVAELIDLVHLEGLGDRYPSQLSGGQRQRVALARALAVEPRVLLLDEPFGALDAKVRQELRRWLRRLHEEIHLTSLFVTHDQEEALELAGRVVIMDHGEIEQQGSPQEVFERPATPFVMNFLGHVNIFHGRVESGKALLGPLALDYPAHPDSTPKTAAGYARPYELDLSRTELSGGLWGTVTVVAQAGSVARIELADAEGRPIQVELSRERFLELQPAAGERFYITPRNVRVFLMDRG